MHIEDAQKNGDTLTRSVRGGNPDGFCDKSVARRHNQAGPGGDGPLGIAKEPEEESRQQQGRNTPRPVACGPSQHNCHRQETQTVNVTVTNHCPQRLYGLCGRHAFTGRVAAHTGRQRSHAPAVPSIAGPHAGSLKPFTRRPLRGARERKSGPWHGVSASSTALPPIARRRKDTVSESTLPTAERSDGVRRAGG